MGRSVGSKTRTSHPSLWRMREHSYASSLEYELGSCISSHCSSFSGWRITYRERRLPKRTRTLMRFPPLAARSDCTIRSTVSSSSFDTQSLLATRWSSRNVRYLWRISASSSFSAISSIGLLSDDRGIKRCSVFKWLSLAAVILLNRRIWFLRFLSIDLRGNRWCWDVHRDNIARMGQAIMSKPRLIAV